MILYVGSSNSTISLGVPCEFHLYSTIYPLTRRPQPHTAYPRVCTDMPKNTVKKGHITTTAHKTTRTTGTHKASYRSSSLSNTLKPLASLSQLVPPRYITKSGAHITTLQNTLINYTLDSQHIRIPSYLKHTGAHIISCILINKYIS